jgi:hypothetical protein
MAEAGPVPHRPEDGKVVAFGPKSRRVWKIASGAPLLVDVEFGRGHSLFALSQGVFPSTPPFPPAGSPALPDTGALLRVNRNGTFTVLEDRLDLPTSLEIIRNRAYVVTLNGEIWRFDHVSCPPHGHSRRRHR